MAEAAELVLAKCVRSMRSFHVLEPCLLRLPVRAVVATLAWSSSADCLARLKAEQLSESHIKFREHTTAPSNSQGVPGIIAPGATGVICA